MTCPCGKHSACVPQCALMDYPGYVVDWHGQPHAVTAAAQNQPIPEWLNQPYEDDGFRTAYPEMPYSPPLPDVTRDPAPVAELVDEIDEWYAANDPLMAGAGDGNSPPWTQDALLSRPFSETHEKRLASDPAYAAAYALPEEHLDRILEQRGERYGAFADNAVIAQAIKDAVRIGKAYHQWPSILREGFEQIAAKLSRAATGDFTYVDNWDDLAGYAKLIADWLRQAS